METRYEIEWIVRVKDIPADRDFNPDTDLEYQFAYRKYLKTAKTFGERMAAESKQDWAAITIETRDSEYSSWMRDSRLCWDGANWINA